MKKLLSVVAFLLFSSSAAAEVFPINQFGGLDTDSNPLTLKAKTPDSQNVVSDLGPGLQGRKGFIDFSTDTADAMWELPHSNGTRYLIKWSDAEDCIEASQGGATFNIYVSSTASGITTVGAVLGDTFYFSNATDGLKRVTFSGATASVTVASATLTFTQLASWKGRLWGAGKQGSERILFGSAYTDGTDWALDATPTDESPIQRTISGAFDESITALFPSPFNTLMVFKGHSFGSVSGSNYFNFEFKVLSEKVGTSYPETIQECDGYVRFLGPSRTVWEYKGGILRPEDRISRGIDNLMATFSQGDAAARQYSWTSQTDFNQGTNYQTSNSLSAGDVVASTWSSTQTSDADFGAGTASNVTVNNNRIFLSTNNTNVENNSFEVGSGTVATNWTSLGGTSPERSSTGATPKDGSWFLSIAVDPALVQILVSIVDMSDTLIGSANIHDGSSYSVGVWEQETLTPSASAGQWVKLRFSRSGGGINTNTVESDPFLYSGGAITYWVTRGSVGTRMLVDLVEGGRSTTYSGTFTSGAFDSSLSSAAWLTGVATLGENGHSILWRTQSSSNGSTWQTSVNWSTGSVPSSDFRRYIRFVAFLSTGSATTGTALPYVDDVTFPARASLGHWVSNSVPTTGMSAHGTFSASHSADGGTISYAVYADSDSSKTVTNGVPVAGTYLSSAAVTSNSIPSLSTGAYIFVTATEQITAGSQNPTVSEIISRWTTGSTLRASSAYVNQRYWLGLAANSASNNRVLVFDRNREWQLYNGINATSMLVYNGSLLFGNSSGIFQGETGNDDDGSSITAYYKTPMYAPAGLDIYTALDMLYMTTENSASSLSTVFQVNGINSDHSMGSWTMNTNSGYQNFKLPFSFEDVQKIKYVDFKWTVTGTTAWKLLNGNVYHSPDLIPE